MSVTEVNEVVELDDDALSGAIEALLLMATEPVPAVVGMAMQGKEGEERGLALPMTSA